MSHYEEEDEELQEHEAKDWELVRGTNLELRAEALLCISRRTSQDLTKQVEALTFAESAIDILRKLGDTKKLAAALWAKADPLYALNRWAEARDASIEAAELSAELLDDSRAGTMFYNAGGCAYNLREYQESYELFTKAKEYHQAASEPIDTGRSVAWAGKNLYELGNFEGAITAYQEAIDLFEPEGSLGKLADACRLLGKAYIRAGKLDLAAKALERSEACLEFCPNAETESKLKFARGLYLAAKGDHVRAIAVFQELYEAAKAAVLPEHSTANAFERAKSEMAIGEYESAAKTFRQISLAVKGTRSDITSLDAMLQLVKAYELAEYDVDHEAALNEVLAMPELQEKSELKNKLTLSLGLLLTKQPDGTRGLKVLEALPRSVFEVGGVSWMEHGMALLENYRRAGRNSECLFLANEILGIADHSYFAVLIAELHAIKTDVLQTMGQQAQAQAEAKIAFEAFSNVNLLNKAMFIKEKFLVVTPTSAEPNYLLNSSELKDA